MRTWTIIFDIPLSGIPLAVQARTQSELKEIALGLDGVHPASPFWKSVHDAGLRLTVGDWIFTYMVDETARTVHVVAAAPRR